MYEVTVFIYDFVTSKTFKKGRALMFQPIPGMVYKEKHTTEDGETNIWLADMVAIVADFEDIAGATSQGHVVILGGFESDTLLPHELASWLSITGWVDSCPPEGIAFDGMSDDEVDNPPSDPG